LPYAEKNERLEIVLNLERKNIGFAPNYAADPKFRQRAERAWAAIL